MATLSSILAWEIPWTEEPDRLQSIGSERFRYDLMAKHGTTSASISHPKGDSQTFLSHILTIRISEANSH